MRSRYQARPDAHFSKEMTLPTYLYKCPDCACHMEVQQSPRTKAPLCPNCDVPTEKQPTAANFVVKGLNAKNGYSK